MTHISTQNNPPRDGTYTKNSYISSAKEPTISTKAPYIYTPIHISTQNNKLKILEEEAEGEGGGKGRGGDLVHGLLAVTNQGDDASK